MRDRILTAMMKVKRTRTYEVADIFEKRKFEHNGFVLPYRLYVPKNYDCGERYPLLVFLHGAGERGDDNEKQISVFVQNLFSYPESPLYDAIVLAPQCPADTQWVLTPWTDNYSIDETPESPALECLCLVIDELRDFYNIDDDRLYVTGLSMGGFGTWDMLSRHGARFAAGIPICGGGDPSYADLLKRIPIRTFHGSDDEAVPVHCTRQMFAAIKKAGGELIDYTEFDGMGHNVWDTVYSDRDVIEWLFAQSLAERRAKAEKKSKIVKAAVFGTVGTLVSAALVLLGVKSKSKSKKK